MFKKYRSCCKNAVDDEERFRARETASDDNNMLPSVDGKPIEREEQQTLTSVKKKLEKDGDNIIEATDDDVLTKATVDDDVVTKATVETIWKTIEKQSDDEITKRNVIKESCSSSSDVVGWKTIRVFVSSTFTDMHSEREILVKKLFPALREWCEERKFTLVDCDLRWGVPKDSNSRTTICTCLEEIDRCHEDNNDLPFFVSMLSDRYGWIPSDVEVPDDVKEKYQWVPEVSITHMEILHGAYRFKNPNAIFCFRNSDYIKDLPSDKLSRFVDKEANNQLNLKVLKTKIVNKFQTNQVFAYNCQVAGIDNSTGREKVKIVGLEKFSEKILEFLKDAIDHQYPNHNLSPELSADQIEENSHKAAMELKSEVFVGREKELDVLYRYVNRDYENMGKDGEEKRSFLRLRNLSDDESKERKAEDDLKEECTKFGVLVTDSRIACVVGESGIGKSSLLAKLAKKATEDGLDVLFHATGCTDVSMNFQMLCKRIIKSIADDPNDAVANTEDGKEEETESTEDLMKKLNIAFKNVANNGKETVIIIDGIDELFDNQSPQFLSWLPPRFPGKVRCVVSCAVNHYPCVARMESRDAYFLDLAELIPEGAAAMVEYYLKRFNKKLDAGQLSSLLEHKSSSIPLWLSIACEELRVFGDFATVTAKIQDFPDDLIKLTIKVFERLITEDETEEKSVEKVLSMIYCSKSGLPEPEILRLLGDPKKKEEAPMVTWATGRRYLKPFIRTTGSQGFHRIKMAHTTMNQAVGELLFADENKFIKWQTYLADYYQLNCTNNVTTVEELPHHLYNSHLWKRMIEFFRTDDRTFSVSNYDRSKNLSKLRCKNFAHKIPMQYAPLVVCTMCSWKGRLLSPSPFQTKDVCAICGSFAPFKQQKDEASLCMQHKPFVPPAMHKCYICNRMFNDSPPFGPPLPLYVCTFCQPNLTCCHLLDG